MMPALIGQKERVNAISGFTLVESLVAMAIFSIGFSGLYFLYNYAQVAIARSEQRMYLNLLGDRILQTIASEAQRASNDALNPFITPKKYSGSLTNCAQIPQVSTEENFRYDWCNELLQRVGSFSGKSDSEPPNINLSKDSNGNLIIEVNLINGDGSIRTSFIRRLRAI